MTDRVKYCLATRSHWRSIIEAPVIMTGLYKWADAFGMGREKAFYLPHTRAEAEEYDIIHINWTLGNAELVAQMHDLVKDSSTKLVVNIDYAVEQWQQMIAYPDWLRRDLQLPDLVFHVESVGARTLGALIGRDVPVIPHPANPVEIRKLARHGKRDGLLQYWHRYDREWMTGWIGGRAYPGKRTIAGLSDDVPGTIISRYDEALTRMDWVSWMRVMGTYSVGLDMFSQHNQGRIAIEHAAAGIPLIGSSTSEAMRVLWPTLECEPYDSSDVRIHLADLPDTVDSAVQYARQAVDFYDLEHSRKRMLEALEDTTPM